MRVLLDNSILTTENIILLKKSKLLDLSKKHSIKIYGNPILLDEIYNLWSLGRKTEMKKYLEYILEISNERWFRDTEGMLRLELENKNLTNKYFFYNNSEKMRIENQIKYLLISEQLTKEDEQEIKRIKDEIELRKSNFNGCCSLLRNQKKVNLKQLNFNDFYSQYSDYCGEELLSRQLNISKENSIINNWKKNKNNFPYSDLWVKGIMYIIFYAYVECNKMLDKNANFDINQLIFLKDLDVVVSEEQRFLKSACNALYGNTKRYFSVEDLLFSLN